MRICINATNVIHGTRAIKRYSNNLIRNLLKIKQENEYLIFYNIFRKGNERIISDLKNSQAAYKNIVCRIPGRVLEFGWNNLDFPDISNFTGKLDILHATDFDIPPNKYGKTVFTLHGLSYLKTPQFYTKQFCRKNKQLLDNALKKIDYVISVSNTTTKEFLEIYPEFKKRIRTIPLGISEEFLILEKESVKAFLAEKFGIEQPYLLYVGAIEPHKGIDNLLKAFKIFIENKHKNYKVVFAGDKGVYFNKFVKTVVAMRLEKHVIFTGYIEQDTDNLAYLYNGADVFVFPSFYEGWASPPLEAMACGIPVIVSNVSSLPESTGDASLKIDPNSPENICSSIMQILENQRLKNELIEKGLKRINTLKWPKIAQLTLNYYNDILSGRDTSGEEYF